MSFDQVKQLTKQVIVEVMQLPAFTSTADISKKAQLAYVRASSALQSTDLMDLFNALDALLNCEDIAGDYVDPKTQEVAFKAEEIREQVWLCLQH